MFESHSPYRLFVANDCGVWMTEDLRHWTDLSATLPNVVVTSLVYHYDDRTLTAATYGRGIWRLHLPVKSHAAEPRAVRWGRRFRLPTVGAFKNMFVHSRW